jgi:hypothetical protein
MQDETTVPSPIAHRIGWLLSGLTILFLLIDSVSKLAMEHHVLEATSQIGYPLDTIRPIGLTLLIITVLYAIPRTAVLGAVLRLCGDRRVARSIPARACPATASTTLLRYVRARSRRQR